MAGILWMDYDFFLLLFDSLTSSLSRVAYSDQIVQNTWIKSLSYAKYLEWKGECPWVLAQRALAVDGERRKQADSPSLRSSWLPGIWQIFTKCLRRKGRSDEGLYLSIHIAPEVPRILSVMHSLNNLFWSHGFKQCVLTEDSQIYISSINAFSECLCISDFCLDISTWIANMLHTLNILNPNSWTFFPPHLQFTHFPYLSKRQLHFSRCSDKKKKKR